MRLSVMVFGLICVCALVIGTAAPLVQDDGDVRGAFLTSRPKEKPATSGTTAKPTHRNPNPSGGGSTSSGSGSTGSSNPDSSHPAKPDKTPNKPGPSGSTPVNARRMGLGVTLFMRDSNGLAVRVDPEHTFQKGDRV